MGLVLVDAVPGIRPLLRSSFSFLSIPFKNDYQIARRFARGGYITAVCRRQGKLLKQTVQDILSQGGTCIPFECDARVEDQVVDLFKTIEANHGHIEVCVFNIGANVCFPIRETSARTFYKVIKQGKGRVVFFSLSVAQLFELLSACLLHVLIASCFLLPDMGNGLLCRVPNGKRSS